jgi:hypothetical protein
VKNEEENTTDEMMAIGFQLGDATRRETLYGPEGLGDASAPAAGEGDAALTILDPTLDADGEERDDAEAH